MSGENIVVFGTQKTLEANGAAIANAAVIQADDASYDVVVDGAGYPDADFVLTGAFAVTPTVNTSVALYARPLNVDGTLDTETPEAVRPTIFIGMFVVNDVANATVQTMVLSQGTVTNLPKVADYFLHNNGTGQTLSAGWTLKVTPRTNKAAV